MNLHVANELMPCVCCRLFREGGIHWGRIITLLCFGYRLAITYLRRGLYGFFSNIISWVVKFVVSERIAQWIADQGGWVSLNSFISNSNKIAFAGARSCDVPSS